MKDTRCFDMDPTFSFYKDTDPLTELTVYGKIHVKLFHLSCFLSQDTVLPADCNILGAGTTATLRTHVRIRLRGKTVEK